MRIRFFLAAMAFVSVSYAAHADSFNFSFGNATDAFSGSGVLTTGTLQAPGEYLITAVTGISSTAPYGPTTAISSVLAPGTFPTPSNGGTFPSNDNVLFLTNDAGSLDGNGLSFILSNGAQINLYDPQGSNYDALLLQPSGARFFADLQTTITAVAPVPEPSTFALMTTGLLSVAGLVRRRLAKN